MFVIRMHSRIKAMNLEFGNKDSVLSPRYECKAALLLCAFKQARCTPLLLTAATSPVVVLVSLIPSCMVVLLADQSLDTSPALWHSIVLQNKPDVRIGGEVPSQRCKCATMLTDDGCTGADAGQRVGMLSACSCNARLAAKCTLTMTYYVCDRKGMSGHVGSCMSCCACCT